ncbi:hypothetical protein OC835_006896 [Tilletia horrida]|nr:hypothetical protein OC835_006896 [Tilletia horrida]
MGLIGTHLELDASKVAVGTVLAVVIVHALVLPLIRFALRPYSATARALPGPPVAHWFAGSWPAHAYTSGRIGQHLQETIAEYGPVCAMTALGRKTSIILGDHKAANYVLLQKVYARSPLRVSILRRHVGRGLLTEEGDTHRRQRKIANPAFTGEAVLNMAPIIQDKTALFMDRLRKRIAAVPKADGPEGERYGTRIDLARDFQCVTLDVIGEAGFAYSFDSLTKDEHDFTPLQAAINGSMGLISRRSLYSILRLAFDKPVTALGRLLGVKEQLELDRTWAVIENVCLDLVQRAKKDAQANADGSSSSAARDVLSLMVRANISPDLRPNQRMSNEELIHTVPVLLLAGHETSSATLSFACQRLMDGENGERIQQRLRDELRHADGWESDATILDSLPYLEAVVRETLRQNPPIRRMSREATGNDIIPLSRPITLRDGSKTNQIRVSKGQNIEFPVFYMNTCEELWGLDGKDFKPERWLPEGHEFQDGTSRMSPEVSDLKGVWSHLMTFGAGPQQCIGVRLALLEIKYVLATLIAAYDILPPQLPGEEPIKMDYLTPIAAMPVIIGQEDKGHAMPVRLRPIAAA